MTVRKYSSVSQETTLTSALSSGATTMVVASSTALLGGITLSGSETFVVVIDPDTALEEIVEVIVPSSSASNTLTVSRPVDGTAAIAHSAGAKVRHMAIGRDFREANNHIENTTSAHGLTIANVVKTTDTGVVTSAMITDNTIVNSDINTSAAIDKTKIAGTAVTVADTGTVTSTMIADGTITNTDINSAAGIAYSKLSLTGSITSSDITDGTIVNVDISPTAGIALSKLATDPLARANHTGTQTASTISNFDTQVRTNRLDQMAAPTAAVSLNSQKVTNLGTPTVSTDASTKGYVDTQITNLIGTAPSTLDTLQEIATAINNDAGLYTTLNNGKLNRDGTQAMTGALPMGTFKITGLGDPTNAQDAATKNYVDTGAASQVAAAAASATAAAASATAASGSATSASGSATSATSSASSATASASSATASASAAATSSTNAANSATSASNSASTASTQATNAANSASSAATSATNSANSASSSAASFTSVDQKYLGAKSSAPTLNNQGGALAAGALYWNTSNNTMYVYTGSVWTASTANATIVTYKYTASGGETSKSGADDNGLTLTYVVGYEQVYINGVLQVRGSDYTATTGSSITGLTALVAGDILSILAFSQFAVADTYTQAQADAKFYQILSNGAAGKNSVLNSGFDIWQRGTSIALAASANGYSADRWYASAAASQASTVSRQATGDSTNLPNIQYALRYQRNAGQTGGAFVGIYQSFESINSIPFAGKTVTLSWYARAGANYSTSGNTLYYQLKTGTGTDQNIFSGYTGEVAAINSAVTLTTTWQRFTATVTLSSTLTELGVAFLCNPSGTAGANDYFDITGVQLEYGSIATPFARNSGTIQGELAACQRYYIRTTGNNSSALLGTLGFAKSTTLAVMPFALPVTMRTAVSAIDTGGTPQIADGNTGYSGGTWALDSSSSTSCTVTYTHGSASLTQYRPYFPQATTSTSYIGFSAEL